VRQPVGQQLAEQVGAERLVVDVADERVLDGVPAAGAAGVVVGGGEHLGDVPAGVDRHQGVAQLVVGGVQADREGGVQPLLGQLPDRRHQAHRGHRHRPLRQPEAVRRGRHERVEGLADPGVVGQRLTHAHEHHVGQPARAAGDLPAGHRRGRRDGLADDLGGGEVAGEAALAGGAERARHAAPGLAGDAHGGPVGVAHEHALDEGAVVQPPQRLAGAPAVGLQVPDGGQQPRQQRLGEVRPRGRRHVGHPGRVGDPGVEVAGQLVGAEGRVTQLGDLGAGLLPGQVGEVARRLGAAGGVEDERQGSHGALHGPTGSPGPSGP
jgi:hypothetical protein